MKLMFDIGAHQGLCSMVGLAQGYKIVAVEANVDMIPQINERIMDANFEVINKLISDKSGVPTKFYVNDKTEISTASYKWRFDGRFSDGSLGNFTKEVMVDSITIDDMIETYGKPDLLKVDVEGYEDVALEGLSHKTDILCFEWQRELGDEIIKCFEKCVKLGYTQFGNVDQTIEKGNVERYLVQPTDWTDDYMDIVNDIQEDPCETSWGMFWCK